MQIKTTTRFYYGLTGMAGSEKVRRQWVGTDTHQTKPHFAGGAQNDTIRLGDSVAVFYKIKHPHVM